MKLTIKQLRHIITEALSPSFEEEPFPENLKNALRNIDRNRRPSIASNMAYLACEEPDEGPYQLIAFDKDLNPIALVNHDTEDYMHFADMAKILGSLGYAHIQFIHFFMGGIDLSLKSDEQASKAGWSIAAGTYTVQGLINKATTTARQDAGIRPYDQINGDTDKL